MLSKSRAPKIFNHAFTLVEVLIVFITLAALLGLGATAISTMNAKSEEGTLDATSETQEDATAPFFAPLPGQVVVEEQPEAPSEPMDLSALWITLGVLGGAGILGVSGVGVTHQVRKAKSFKNAAKEAQNLLFERWKSANTRHLELEQEYGTYLLDLQEIFKRPALSDVSVPETATFIEAHALLGPVNITPAKTSEEVEQYERKVSAAWSSWRLASAQATKLGLGVFTNEERKKVERASQLLKMALDPAASEFERAQAYQQVKKLVEGLIAIPEPTRLRIEAKTRPALTALKS